MNKLKHKFNQFLAVSLRTIESFIALNFVRQKCCVFK